MDEALRKPERLRAARLANGMTRGVAMDELPNVTSDGPAAAPAEALPTLCYEVVRHRGSWRVLHVGKYSKPHASQEAAIGAAMKIAMTKEAAGRTVCVRLVRTDGQVFDLSSTEKKAPSAT